MASELVLTYMSGPRDGDKVRTVVTEESPEVTFGRSDACTVKLDYDGDVSRKHARIWQQEGNWWLVDLGSTNGTHLGEFKQARKIAEAVCLAPGQIFRMGATRFRLEDPSARQQTEAKASKEAEDGA